MLIKPSETTLTGINDGKMHVMQSESTKSRGRPRDFSRFGCEAKGKLDGIQKVYFSRHFNIFNESRFPDEIFMMRTRKALSGMKFEWKRKKEVVCVCVFAGEKGRQKSESTAN